MVKNKKWISVQMFLHMTLVFITTLLFSQQWVMSVVITVIHYLVDGLKKEFEKHTIRFSTLALFVADQLTHLVTLIFVWAVHFRIMKALWTAAAYPFSSYKASLILLGYLVVIGPLGYVIKFATKNMIQYTSEDNPESRNGGKKIGIFERIIILTFVLLGQYQAIGFLITGKSILRYADKNSDLKSEYVLVGTMMSYGMAILIGVFINWLLAIDSLK